MILELGAGGLITIPRREFEYHTKDLWGPHGVKIGDAVIDTNLKKVPWRSTKHERYHEDVYDVSLFGLRRKLIHRQGDLKLNYANRAIPIEEKEMVQVIDGGPEGTVYIGDSKVDKMAIVIDGHGNETYIPRESEKIGGVKSDDFTNKDDSSAFEQAIKDIPEIQYERYYRDIPKRDASGRIVLVEIDGIKQVVYDHRKGDIILDSKGNPRIIQPGSIPCPQWFTRAERERPSQRYDARDLYYRSLEGITAVLSGLSNEDLVSLDSVLDPLIHARLNGEATQVIKSKYLPRCTIYGGGEIQYELFDDTGNLTEVLSEDEIKARYGDTGIE